MSEPAKPFACPFCGRLGSLEEEEELPDRWSVSCSNQDCPIAIRTVAQGTQAEAIARWNTRAADPRIAELEARHAKAIACLKLIAAPDTEFTTDAAWCADQALRALEECNG